MKNYFNKRGGVKPYMQVVLPLFVFSLLPTANLHAETGPALNSGIESTDQAEKKVTGQIVDKTGEPIIGANIVEKGTTNGTISGMDGSFSLSVSDNAVLEISYIGYLTRDIPVSGQSHLSIEMSEDTQSLDEVVVVGYGAQKKVNLTGSVATINLADETMSRPVTTISSALSGMAAGLNVMQTTAKPNSEGASVQIRGTGTLNDSSPLILVDGMEMSLNEINPNDVESISVLKDAASCAIYGNRGANGVILVTTKKGKDGKVNVTYPANSLTTRRLS